jgi:hypothetical protein
MPGIDQHTNNDALICTLIPIFCSVDRENIVPENVTSTQASSSSSSPPYAGRISASSTALLSGSPSRSCTSSSTLSMQLASASPSTMNSSMLAGGVGAFSDSAAAASSAGLSLTVIISISIGITATFLGAYCCCFWLMLVARRRHRRKELAGVVVDVAGSSTSGSFNPLKYNAEGEPVGLLRRLSARIRLAKGGLHVEAATCAAAPAAVSDGGSSLLGEVQQFSQASSRGLLLLRSGCSSKSVASAPSGASAPEVTSSSSVEVFGYPGSPASAARAPQAFRSTTAGGGGVANDGRAIPIDRGALALEQAVIETLTLRPVSFVKGDPLYKAPARLAPCAQLEPAESASSIPPAKRALRHLRTLVLSGTLQQALTANAVSARTYTFVRNNTIVYVPRESSAASPRFVRKLDKTVVLSRSLDQPPTFMPLSDQSCAPARTTPWSPSQPPPRVLGAAAPSSSLGSLQELSSVVSNPMRANRLLPPQARPRPPLL